MGVSSCRLASHSGACLPGCTNIPRKRSSFRRCSSSSSSSSSSSNSTIVPICPYVESNHSAYAILPERIPCPVGMYGLCRVVPGDMRDLNSRLASHSGACLPGCTNIPRKRSSFHRTGHEYRIACVKFPESNRKIIFLAEKLGKPSPINLTMRGSIDVR
jgi:hypothetical protein